VVVRGSKLKNDEKGNNRGHAGFHGGKESLSGTASGEKEEEISWISSTKGRSISNEIASTKRG